MTVKVDKMRDEFEQWWEFFKATHDEWRYADTEALLFQAWQARRAAVEVELPPFMTGDTVLDYTFNLAVADATRLIKKQGLRVKQ